MFDKEKAIADFNHDKENTNSDHETNPADMIITQFEMGKLTYEQAKQQLIDDDLSEWIHELNMAAELQTGNH
jgi:hypothetical protein